MSKLVALTKVLIKNNVLGFNSKSKRSKYGTMIAVSLLLVFVVASVCIPMAYVLSSILEVAPIEKILLSLVLPIGGIAVIVFSIFSTVSVFCLNKDSDYLLPMPIEAKDIILAKFLVSLITQYYILLMFILPCLIGIGIGMEAGIMYYIYSALVFVFMPIIPSAIVTIIILLITSFTGLMRNKDLFIYVSMGLVLAFSFGYNYILQNVLVIDPNNIGSTLGSLEAEIIPLCKKIFPFYNSGANALINYNNMNGLFSLITFISLNFITLFVVYILGDKLYLRALIDTRGSKKKETNIEEVDYKFKKSSSSRWLFKKEWLIIKRTPIFMLNIVIIIFLMPLIIAFSFVVSYASNGGDSSSLLNIGDIGKYLDSPYMFFIVLAVFAFFTSCSVAASTSISREGSNAWFMKVIPVSIFKQINIKVLFACLLDVIGVIFAMIIPIIMYKIPMYYVLCVFVPLVIIIILSNYFNIWIDLKRPKLKWSEESEAVKQNLNAMISIFVTMGLCAVFGILAFVFYYYNITINVVLLSVLISVVCGIILGLVIYYFYKNSDKLVKSID